MYTNSANPTLEAGADKINLGLMASVGVEKKPNHGTEPVDGNSKTEAKDLNLSKEDLAKLQKPGVDVEITVGGQKYIVTRTESGTLIASSVGPNSQDFVVRMDGNGNYVIDVPVSPGS